MTTPNHRTAAAALDAARPLITRLDAGRHPEDVAADVIEAWQSVETALRALLGGSALTGQALVGEVRRRGLLDYRHAHDLLGFLAARDRASRAGYRPDAADVDASRTGYQSLEAALGLGIGALTGVHQTVSPVPNAGGAYGTAAPLPPTAPPRQRAAAGPLGAPPLATPGLGDPAADLALDGARRPRNRPSRSILTVAAVALAVVLAGVFWWMNSSGGPRATERGVAAYRNGQKDIARREFQAAVEADPNLATPHVYLARIAREDGDLTRANAELQTAIRAEPRNAVALREMGQLMLQSNRPELAVNWLKRAVEADNADRVAMGWLACALARQGNGQLASSFASRAGQGDWSGCVTQAPPYPPGAVPAGQLPPGAMPPGGYPPAPVRP
jgi:tetratricopeptide (TPR) repeat protein